MHVAAHVTVPLPPDALERDALDAVWDRLAPLFQDAAGPRSALLVASADAGRRTTLRFWADARRVGVGLANPELFPWCLANAACGAIARRFSITGPNATWLGGDEALQAAWEAAESHLARGDVERAFVVAARFGPAAGHRPTIEVWRVGAEPRPDPAQSR